MKIRIHTDDHKLLKTLSDKMSISMADVLKMILNGHILKKQIKQVRLQINAQQEKERQYQIDQLNEDLILEEDDAISEFQRIEEEMRRDHIKLVK